MLQAISRRLIQATAFLALTVFVGTVGYHALGDGRWTLFDCFYHTVITISTVGYGELPGVEAVHFARGFTVLLIVCGTGTMVYFVSTVTALIVEGDLRDVLRRNRMRKTIEAMHDHVIVCGIGRTGLHVLDELRAMRCPVLAIDQDAEKLARLGIEHPEMACIAGDATEDEVLTRAGIARARGIIAALADDKDNLYVSLTARALNPGLRIVAKCVEAHAEAKLRKAGADRVVSTNMIGGLRLASEMVRPNATEFLDIMLRDTTHVLRVEEATVAATSSLAGRTLGAAQLRRVSDVLVVAVRAPDGTYTFNPGAEQLLEPGLTVIVLGARDEIEKLRAAAGEAR
jgi:voltage-gated potassium channel